MEPQSPKFMTMATVVMEIGSKYFSCLQGPMAHLHAKFCQDRAINNRDKIMSQKNYGQVCPPVKLCYARILQTLHTGSSPVSTSHWKKAGSGEQAKFFPTLVPPLKIQGCRVSNLKGYRYLYQISTSHAENYK